jgi:hypothetical protein
MSTIKNTIPILIFLFIAFSSSGGCAQSDDAQGGYILLIDLDVSSSTEYWLGYYGSVIPASENPYYLDNRARIQEINVTQMGGCLLITNSQDVPNMSNLTAGNPAMIDAIIGTGCDSGRNTFTETENYRIYDRLLTAPTTYTLVNCSESTYFKEGFFTEQGKNNLIFIVPIIENATCYNAMPCNFQFILPNNPISPMTYQMYHIPEIILTEPYAISLSAYPGIIEADGIETSTITAIVTDKSGRMVNWTKNKFTTTLGDITPLTAVNANGTTTTILISSTSQGTAIVEGIITDNPYVHDTVHVQFIRTAEARYNGTLGNVTVTVLETGISMANTTVAIKDGIMSIDTTQENASIIAGNATAGMVISIPVTGGSLDATLKDDAIAVVDTVIGNISKIRLNTPTEEYVTSKTDVGTASVDLDVDFQGTVTPYRYLSFKTTLVERYRDLEYLNVSDTSRLKETIAAYFGADTSSIADNTPILVYAQLSITDLISSEVMEVPISITLNKDWFDTVARGDPGNVVLFEINETTGELEDDITMTPESIDITGDRVTFRATFDHFSVFTIVARPPAAIHPGSGGGGPYLSVPSVTPTSTAVPAPVDDLGRGGDADAIGSSDLGDRPEEKPEREKWPYFIWIILLAIGAGIFLILLWRSRNDKKT